MRLALAFFAVFFVSVASFGQSPEEDEVNFQSATDWLYSKLNYIYYDSKNGKWWKNTFYVNEEKQITIKHISSNKPNTANLKEKDYTIRSFQIQDIDPNSLKVTEIKETQGRIVKGERLELRTFGFQNLIQKSINNRKGSSTSFLFLSFPEVLKDSLSNYAEVVKENFLQAIVSSTHVYSKGNEEDIEQIMTALTGTFKSISGNTWEAKPIKPNVLQVETAEKNISYFGYDSSRSSFYLLTISSDGVRTNYFKFSESPFITLEEQDGERQIQIESLNDFQLGNDKYFRK